MAQPTLAARVAALERQVKELKASAGKPALAQDWRSTFGMFTGNDAMKAIDAAGRAWRDAENGRDLKKRFGKKRAAAS